MFCAFFYIIDQNLPAAATAMFAFFPNVIQRAI